MSEERSTTARAWRSTGGGMPAPLALALAALMALLLALAAMASPAAHASAARHSATHRYKYNFSRIAFTGTRIVVAATDSDGDLDMFWQKVGTPMWHKEVVAKGSRAHRYAKPSITWTGHDVAIAAVTTSGGLFYFAQPQGSSHWKHQHIATASGGKYQAPSIAAEAGGPILIIAATNAGELVSFEQASTSTTWAQQDVASGTFGAPSALITDGIELITVPMGTALELYWRNVGSTPTWTQETVAESGGGPFTGATLAANSNTLLLATSVGGSVYFLTQHTGGSGWTLQLVSTGTGSNAYSNPQIAWTAATDGAPISYDVIAATTASGNLVFWWAENGSATPLWTPETIAPSTTGAIYANPGIGITAKSVVITDINSQPGNVDFWRQTFNTTPWHHQVVAKG
jgi:hypothetical protein